MSSQVMSSGVATSTSSPSSSSDTTPALSTMPMQQQAAFTYALYLHREELRKRQSSSMRISRTKLLLTHELITKTVKNINKCSADDLEILSRETIFKKNLFRQIARMRHRQHMEMLRLQQQQKGNQSQQQQQQNGTKGPQGNQRQPLQQLQQSRPQQQQKPQQSRPLQKQPSQQSRPVQQGRSMPLLDFQQQYPQLSLHKVVSNNRPTPMDF